MRIHPAFKLKAQKYPELSWLPDSDSYFCLFCVYVLLMTALCFGLTKANTCPDTLLILHSRKLIEKPVEIVEALVLQQLMPLTARSLMCQFSLSLSIEMNPKLAEFILLFFLLTSSQGAFVFSSERERKRGMCCWLESCWPTCESHSAEESRQ